MRERRPLFGYGLQRSGMSAVYHSVCERVDFSIRFDTLWHSCGISTRQWKGYRSSRCLVTIIQIRRVRVDQTSGYTNMII